MNKSKTNWHIKLGKENPKGSWEYYPLNHQLTNHRDMNWENIQKAILMAEGSGIWSLGWVFLWIPFASWDICVTYKVPQKPLSVMYYHRRKSVKLKSAGERGVATNQVKSFYWTWAREPNWGSSILPAKLVACRPLHITHPLLIKQTLLFRYVLAPTGCFLFRFSVAHISISRVCILLLLLLKYCFFLFKIPFNQIAPAGMSCQRYSFQWTLALCCITLATRLRGKGLALNLSESPTMWAEHILLSSISSCHANC